jgi:hypothetical protein
MVGQPPVMVGAVILAADDVLADHVPNLLWVGHAIAH